MKEGAIYRSFTTRDGRKVTLRAPKWGDLDDMLHFINSLVEEKAMILMNEMRSLVPEKDKPVVDEITREEQGHLVALAEARRPGPPPGL